MTTEHLYLQCLTFPQRVSVEQFIITRLSDTALKIIMLSLIAGLSLALSI